MLLQVIFVLDELLKYKPYSLNMETDEKCVLELAGAKGLSYTNTVVKLFERGCDRHEVLKTLVLLITRQSLDDYIVSCCTRTDHFVFKVLVHLPD